MHITVTGATGFVGQHLLGSLLDRGDSVRGLLRRPGDERLPEHVDGRVAPLETLRPADVEGSDAIVHLAAATGGDIDELRRSNRDGTGAVVRAAVRAGVPRLIHLSTAAVYDLGALGDIEVGEDAPLRTRGRPYGVTKAEAEQELEVARQAGLTVVVLRPSAVLGTGPTSTWGTRVPTGILQGRPRPMSPAATRAWIHIADLTTALVAGLEVESSVISHAVAGHTTVGAYLDHVGRMLGIEPDVPPEDGDPWRGRFSTNRLLDELKVSPTVDFDSAMDEIARWWQDHRAS